MLHLYKVEFMLFLDKNIYLQNFFIVISVMYANDGCMTPKCSKRVKERPLLLLYIYILFY